jgi:hypothetical protein
VRRPEDVQDTLQEQIRTEKVGALRRATDRLARALELLAAFDAEAAANRQPPAAEGHADLLAEAGERLWCLVIQREAMGLLRHEVVYDVLRIPGEVRRAMGPRRRRR